MLLPSGLIDFLLGKLRGRLSTLGIAVFSAQIRWMCCFRRLHPVASQVLILFSWVCEFWPYLENPWLCESSDLISVVHKAPSENLLLSLETINPLHSPETGP